MHGCTPFLALGGGHLQMVLDLFLQLRVPLPPIPPLLHDLILRRRTLLDRACLRPLCLITSLLRGFLSSSHSYLNATTGSTRIARMAGTRIAAMAINVSNTATQTNVIGS